MTVEPSWDDGVIWGPPCQCGGEYIPHRHGSSSDANSTWIRTGPMSNVDSSDDRLQAIADVWNAAGQTFPTLPQDPPARGRETVRIFWPELASAIKDALTEEKS